MRRRLLAAIALTVVGSCGPSDPDSDDCVQPLSSFCRGACPSYDESVATVKPPDGTPCCAAQIGVCGPYKFTLQSFCIGGQKRYFDSAGRLVAAERLSDVPEFCGGESNGQWYGKVVSCAPQVVEDLCPH